MWQQTGEAGGWADTGFACGIDSGPDVEVLNQPVGIVEDEISLGRRAVVGALTSKCFQTSYQEFQLYPIGAQFHSEYVGAAVFVLDLDDGENVIRDLDPEHFLDPGSHGVFPEMGIDSFHIGF
jgi:hypothetical protein